MPDRDAARRPARPRRGRGALGTLLRAAAQGRGLLGELVADGGAVRDRRSCRQAHLEARRLGAPVAGLRVGSRIAARGQGLESEGARLLAVRDEGEVTRSLMQARCERGAQIARMLGLSETTAQAIYALDEHWDGAGHPTGCAASRSRSARASGTSPRPSRSSGPRAVGAPPARRPQAPRRLVRPGAGRRAGRDRRADSGPRSRPGSQPHRPRRPATVRRRRRAGPDRRRLRGGHRRQVALDLPPLRPHERDRALASPRRSTPTAPRCAISAGRRGCTTSASSASPTRSSRSRPS